MALTPKEIETEYWAHYYLENGDKEEFEDESFDINEVMSEEFDDDEEWETIINEN